MSLKYIFISALGAVLFLIFGPVHLNAQLSMHQQSVSTAGSENEDEYIVRTHHALEIPVRGYGIAFGHAPRTTGLRFNYRDVNLERVRGINTTIWSPREEHIRGDVYGMAIGVPLTAMDHLYGIGVAGGGLISFGDIHGVSVSGLGTVSASRINGVHAAGFAVVSGETMRGVNFGGLAVVSGGDFYGAGFGGLAVVAGDELSGFHAGGLAVVSGESFRGAATAGLAMVSGGDFNGIGSAGLALVAGENITGVTASGIATVSGGKMTGIGVSGITTVAADGISGIHASGLVMATGGTFSGLNVSGLVMAGERFAGVNITPGMIVGRDLDYVTISGGYAAMQTSGLHIAGLIGYLPEDGVQRGLGVGPVHFNQGVQSGLTIGLFNYARQLNGVQIGLINVAMNKTGIGRVLPIINF